MYTYEKEEKEPVKAHVNHIQKPAGSVRAVSFPSYHVSADVRYRKLPAVVRQKPVIQCIKSSDFQKDGRQVHIINKDILNMNSESQETQRVKESPILAEGIFQTPKSKKKNELVSLAAGENYLQLGWDSCILLQQAEDEKYRVSRKWVMDDEGLAEEGKLIYRDQRPPQQGMLPANRVVDSLVTWSVSSCEVVILISEDWKSIAVMHIDDHLQLPWEVLKSEEGEKAIKWKKAFISLIDDPEEIARTQKLLDELKPAEIIILDRRELEYCGENAHPYIGMNLTGENTPQVFGLQGDKAPTDVDARINMIWNSESWEYAKKVLPGYQSIIDALEDFLFSMKPKEAAPGDRDSILEASFQRLKQGDSIWTRAYRNLFHSGGVADSEYRRIFESIIRTALREQQHFQEQPFLINL